MKDYKTVLLLEMKDKPLEEQVEFFAEKYNEAMNTMWTLLQLKQIEDGTSPFLNKPLTN